MITLVPVGAGAGARAQLYWEFGQGGKLVVSGMPPPPPGRTYQLWLGSIKLGNRVSAGLLTVDSRGEGALRVAPPRATWSPDIFGVTVERQGGAREPSDELVLIGELTRQTVATAKEPGAPVTSSQSPSSGAMASGQSSAPASPLPSEARPPSTPAPITPASPAPGAEAPPTVAAVLPPSGPDAPLVRIVPVPAERAWSLTQSVLRSLGWNIERANQGEGLIRTAPRNLDFKNVGVYATGTRHALDLVVRAVSDTHTSISVKRELFEEERILWSRERTKLPSRDTAVEQSILDAIEHRL